MEMLHFDTLISEGLKSKKKKSLMQLMGLT